MPREKVAIYLRKSRAEEGIEALSNHKAVLTRLAESKGFEYDIYEEIGSSVHLDWREELNKLLANLDKYSYVLVMDLDRLARSLVVMEEIKEKLRYYGVKILTPTQEIDLNNETNEMLMDFQSVIAKAEYQQIRKRMRIGKIEGARQGHWVNGVAPLGYTYDRQKRKLVINEAEYPLVREIFNLALKNMSYMEIAINLNLRGFRTRQGNPFTNHSIKAILINRAYVGDVTYRVKSKVIGMPDEVIVTHNAHPAIVTESEWLEVQKLIQQRRTNVGKVTTVVKSAIQGLVYCGCCGAKLGINPPSKKANRKDIYIKGCSTVDAFGKRCPNKSIKLEPVEKAVIEQIKILKDKAIEKARQLLNVDNSDLKKELQAKIEAYKAEIKKQEAILDKLLDSYIENIISKEVYTKKQEEKKAQIQLLKDDVRRLELQLEGLDTDRQLEHLKEVIRVIDNFEGLDVQEQNRILMQFVKRITLTVLPDESKGYRRAKLEPVLEVELHEGA
jgi:site-specific DNA recombinase